MVIVWANIGLANVTIPTPVIKTTTNCHHSNDLMKLEFVMEIDIFSFSELTLNPPEGIVAGPISEDNFFEWEALIQGPEGTCFEGGVFPARLIFPPDYPLSPPKMKFTCEMFHPNSKLYDKKLYDAKL